MKRIQREKIEKTLNLIIYIKIFEKKFIPTYFHITCVSFHLGSEQLHPQRRAVSHSRKRPNATQPIINACTRRFAGL